VSGSVIDLNKPLEEDDGWKLLEQRTINDRTIIAWYNPTTTNISLCLFHLTDQPNSLSLNSPYSTWGYVTHMETGMYTCKEAAEVVSLYLQDLENGNYWWENK
jgi:hypothetical protein